MSDTPDEKTPDEPIDDDLIMPYADGVLPPEQRPAVRDALASDPALMQKFESFLFTRGPIARAFDEVLAAPIPERLLAAVREPAPPRTRPAASCLRPVAPGAARRPVSHARLLARRRDPGGAGRRRRRLACAATALPRTSYRWKDVASWLRRRCSRRSSRRRAAAPPISPTGSR